MNEPTRTWTCDCGRELARFRGQGDQTCECGAEYNAFGQRLAPREQWGEETGETVADIYGPDPERMPGESEYPLADEVYEIRGFADGPPEPPDPYDDFDHGLGGMIVTD